MLLENEQDEHWTPQLDKHSTLVWGTFKNEPYLTGSSIQKSKLHLFNMKIN